VCGAFSSILGMTMMTTSLLLQQLNVKSVQCNKYVRTYVRLEILFITQQREKHEGILVFFPSSVNFFFRHFPPLLSHGWKVKKNPENLFFLFALFYFPMRKQDSRILLLMGEKVKII
jgi:hypothetical protein